ncbi:serine protease [Bdellovibrio bacteriovorus]|uniref:Serine protease n=1 Tax=Bdellovibrio bacteriovorus TaxID=959 RepID=A0A162GC63_BDEBC|nr:trypsin-like serine protease [Bdellovibrio bacteriovorus]KYG67787.1 serine protease [Bdellovibrio bacteriovorus]
MFKKLSLTLAVALTLSACAETAQQAQVELSGQQKGVIGGDKVEANSRISRSTVGLYDENAKALCTGTLIAPNLVLTAAHCIDPTSDKMVVLFGQEFKNADASQLRRVVKKVQHKFYGEMKAEDMYDIAMLRFEGTAPAGYAPAPLLSDFSGIRKNTEVVVAGFGLNWAWGVKKGAGTLRTTTLKVKSPMNGSTEIMLDQSLRRGICSGDSGGPAYLDVNGQLYLLGVASRGDSLPIPLTPDCFILSVFTRVDAHADWINETALELLK